MKKNYLKLAIIFFAFFAFSGCQKKEISLLNELNKKLKETNGNVAQAKQVLKRFLNENEKQINEAVLDFQNSRGEDRDYRYLDFNRHYYDKDGIRELVDFTYKYTMDPDFNKIFEEFKKKWDIFFKEDLTSQTLSR